MGKGKGHNPRGRTCIKFGSLESNELYGIERCPSDGVDRKRVISNSGAPARAKRAWDRAPYSWNMVNLFSLGCHVTDRAYVRTYASTDCTGRVGETIKRKGGVSQACVGKSSSFLYDIHNIVN